MFNNNYRQKLSGLWTRSIFPIVLWSLVAASQAHAVDVIKSSSPLKDKVVPGLLLEEPSKLSLNAQATIRKPANELQMKIGVISLSEKADTALVENSMRMQSVVNGLISAGLTRSEYETGHFTIHPTYTPYPKDPSPDWKPSINGYEVSNSILVYTNKLESAGKLIDAANKAGANNIDNIRFILSDPHVYWNEAITAATINALNDAKAVADAADVKLVKLLSISLENPNISNPRDSTMFATKAFNAGAVPIEPGDVSITANVSVTYEIAPFSPSPDQR